MADEDNVISHIIDISHIITDCETSWKKFQFVGLSGQDGKIYLVAYRNDISSVPEIGIFSGNSLFSDSWKLIFRFFVTDLLDSPFTAFSTDLRKIDSLFAAFSTDFAQIGIIIGGQLDNTELNVFGNCVFIIFDLYSFHLQKRLFIWELRWRRPDLAHTHAGWIVYEEYIEKDTSIYRLTMDPTKNCVDILCPFPTVTDATDTVDDSCNVFSMFVTNDRLFLFPFASHSFFMYIIHLNGDGFPSERYTIDSCIDHIIFSPPYVSKKFLNNVPIFKVGLCQCTFGQPCSDLPATSKDDWLLYTVDIDSDKKQCQTQKVCQFKDHSAMIFPRLAKRLDCMLTKTKRLAIIDFYSHPTPQSDRILSKLYLETLIFNKLPTLKELCSLTLAKMLCQKSTHEIVLPNDVRLSKNVWSGGPSEEAMDKLGLNSATLRFGELKP